MKQYLPIILFKGRLLPVLILFLSTVVTAQERTSPPAGTAGKITIKGTVTDANNTPMPGVTVAEKGTGKGTITNERGNYLLDAADNATLVFSLIGMEKQEVPVAGNSVINIRLTEGAVRLSEVVAIGYGNQSRATVTSSISKVGQAEFAHAPAANPLNQLQGKVAGVSLQISDGQPGANPQIFIRGGSSTSPQDDAPLIIVDGIVGVMRNISDLNPDDIESLQVLKDAASTAIYGARAANGIIIVKTKSGRAGKPVVNFRYTHGIEEQGKKHPFTSAKDYIYISRKNIHDYNTTNPDFFLTGGRYGMSTGNPRNSRNTLEFLDTYVQNYGQGYVDQLLNKEGWQTMEDPVTGKQLIFKETNYQDVTFQTAYKHEYDFNVGGGTDKATYYLGLGYLNQDGIVSGTFYKNYTGLFNGTYKLSDRLSINTNIGYQIRNANAPNNYQNVLARSVTMPFTYRLNYEDGKPAPGEGKADYRNRNHEVYYKEQYTDIKVYRTTFRLGADWSILPGLTFSPAFYWFTTEGVENRFEAANEVNARRDAAADHDQLREAQVDGLLTYDKQLGAKHHINAVLGTSYINHYSNEFHGEGYGAATDNIKTLNATKPETQRTSTTISEDVVLSFFGRINYDFDAKYLFSASLRRDGSSRFAENNRWALFPGVSAGWNIHREDFWQPLSRTVSNLKLRASWGKSGNNDLTFSDSQGSYSTGYNYMGEVGLQNTTLPNQDLLWETTTSSDIGLDIGLFKDRITLLLDFYNKETSDRLFDKPIPSYSGFGSIKSNYGTIRNRGFEVELAATSVRTKNFSWDVNFTFAFNRSTVVKLPANGEDKNRIGGNYIFDPATGQTRKVGGFAEGERFGQRWAYSMTGVYATDEDAKNAPFDENAKGRQKKGGDAIWADLDKDGRITNKDMIFMGYIRPDRTGGMANTFRYKGFALRAVVDYAMGHVIDNGFRARSNASGRNNNMTITDQLSDKTWKKQGDIATIPKYTVQSDVDYDFRNHLRWDNQIGSTGYASNNSLYFSKGDFLAFREVSLSYQLNAGFLKNTFIRGVELFAGVYNIGYITGYDGLMPEIYEGFDRGSYPRPRQFNFSIKGTF